MAEEETTTTEESTTEESTTDETTAADEVAKWKALARKHEKEAKRLRTFETTAQQLQEQSKTEAEKAIEAARREATEAAGKEAMANANARIVRAEVKAAAGGKVIDIDDALAILEKRLDFDEFIDDDGEVDSKAIAKAVADLVKDKPHLAADAKGKPRPGSADGGARGTNGSEVDTSARGLITAGLEAAAADRSRR